FLSKSGVVTEKCQPFNASLRGKDDPQCAEQCRDEENFETSKHFGQKPYVLGNRTSDNDTTPTDQEAIQREIMANGPVAVGGFKLFEDFFYYKSGIYVPVKHKKEGSHIARLVGWGEADGLPYWLVANSWGTATQENGFFRVIRGINAMNIEMYAYAAEPKI
ncbi:cathepsin B-like proteinase, partial [Aphelenchoides avenae]